MTNIVFSDLYGQRLKNTGTNMRSYLMPFVLQVSL